MITGALLIVVGVAWASAWSRARKTMHWLADAEDLIEDARERAAALTYEHDVIELQHVLDAWQRRTPRRAP